MFYLFSSFRDVMPWSSCSHPWNTDLCSERMRAANSTSHSYTPRYRNEAQRPTHDTQTSVSSADEYYHIYMLGINKSTGLSDLGSIKIDLLLCLIAIFVLMYMCIYRGVKSTGTTGGGKIDDSPRVSRR